MIALLTTGFRKDSNNKKYYYFLLWYLLFLLLLTITGLLIYPLSLILLIAPHLWFVRKHKLTVPPQIARSWYFVLSPIITLILFYTLSFTKIFAAYASSPLNLITSLIQYLK